MTKRRLYFDIETSPNIGIFWTAGFKLNIGYENIIKERAIICICYKWEGEKKVHSLTWNKKQCDKKLLKEFIKVANQADELIGHNGDNFDIKWIRTRCLKHNISMFPKYVTIDTLKFAKSHFRFNSNKLDYISKFLGQEGKLPTGLGLWKKVCLNNDATALSGMVKYCCGDVEQLEKVFKRMSNYLPAKVHYGVKDGKHKSSCPECGSKNTRTSLTRVSALGTKRIQKKCNDCGKYHTIAA